MSETNFPTSLSAIENRIRQIQPAEYGRTRNHKDGAVTHLSPYISRGVISTRQVYHYLLSLELSWQNIGKLVQELAWRDYWQQVWVAKGDAINEDLKHKQERVNHHNIPTAIVNADTKIEVIDEAIDQLFKTGYMHNHARMYVAALACNIAQSHWKTPARWMYYNLLDGDWASNALSWQWVAGANASKKYFANQENLNTFFNSNQKGTYIDVPYESFDHMAIPEELKETEPFDAKTILPEVDSISLSPNKTTLVYNYYNLDPKWYANKDVQRVLLLEPSFFAKYPVSPKCLNFVLGLTENIAGINVLVAEFADLEKMVHTENLIYKEHPTNSHYKGKEEPRDWLYNVRGYYPSFFAFWKKCKKEMKS